MPTRRRTTLALQARRILQPILSREGSKVRQARHRRKWGQRELGRRVGVSQATISAIERGDGTTLSIELWQQLALVLELPLELTLGRDAFEQPVDAGHLAIQELVLRLGRQAGRTRRFELSTKPADPVRSTDVGLIDDSQRCLILIECVNAVGNLNAAVRSSDRKRADADGLAVAMGHGEPYRVRLCWIVRATRRNRQLLATYPEIFANRFPGSSAKWVRSLMNGDAPPEEPGLVWCDVAATRLFEWRARVAG